MRAGSLPDSWGGHEGFPAMSLLLLGDNALTGTLPASWGGNMSWPRLTRGEYFRSQPPLKHFATGMGFATSIP